MIKEVLIFGSSGALGRGVADVFLKKDYDKVHLFDFELKETELVGNSEFHPVRDLTVEKNVSEAFSWLTPSKDKLFFLFSTVGGFTGGKALWETEYEEFDKMMKMNLQSSFLLGKYFSKLVSESAGGSICFTAALTGLVPEQNRIAYGTSKGALVHFVKLLAEDGMKINLTANAFAPYIIDTPANREWMKDFNFDELVKPGEIGELAHGIFVNFHIVTGNVIVLKQRLKSIKYNE